MSANPPSDWVERIRSAERSGDFLVAYDLALQGLTEHPDNVDLRYLGTRVLARSGAIDHTAELYRRYRLAGEDSLDFAMLGARIAKDAALAAVVGRRAVLRTIVPAAMPFAQLKQARASPTARASIVTIVWPAARKQHWSGSG